jgi:hypothetical protein
MRFDSKANGTGIAIKGPLGLSSRVAFCPPGLSAFLGHYCTAYWRGSFTLNLPLASRHSITSSASS